MVLQAVVAGMEDIEKDVHDIDKRLVRIEAVLDRLENNHLSHMEKDMLRLANALETLEGRMYHGTIAFYFQFIVVALAVIGFLVTKMLG